MRVLVIDDEPVSRLSTARLLGDAGHDAVWFATIKEGLAQEVSFDVVLIDIRWPCSAALGILKDIKSANPDSAALLVSARWNHLLRTEALERGAYAVLEKPFGFNALENVLKVLAGSPRFKKSYADSSS